MSATAAEVWRMLRSRLADDDLLLANVRVTDRAKDYEAALVVVLIGAGAVVVDVLAGPTEHAQPTLRLGRSGRLRLDALQIDPVGRVLETKHAFRRFVEGAPLWRARPRTRIRWGHAVVLPDAVLVSQLDRRRGASGAGATPTLDRLVIDQTRVHGLADELRAIALRSDRERRVADATDATLIRRVLGDRGRPQRDLVALADAGEDVAEAPTQDQAKLLDAASAQARIQLHGGAGCGKTWLAVEQARRLAVDGKRVALLCYSRGLALYLRRLVAGFPPEHRPSYVGTFHALGRQWGIRTPASPDESWWDTTLPTRIVQRAERSPPARRYDAVVLDEGQDFTYAWWYALLALLRDRQRGGLYVCVDDGQRVFPRVGRPPVRLTPMLVRENMRSTRPIGDVLASFVPMAMRVRGGDGPPVHFVPTAPEYALATADEVVARLLAGGRRPADVAVLTTGHSHPRQVRARADGLDAYWSRLWDRDDVFYGHVRGFKGLERSAVVLALNAPYGREQARELLYVGLSRARDELVVCGDTELIAQACGKAVAERLSAAA